MVTERTKPPLRGPPLPRRPASPACTCDPRDEAPPSPSPRHRRTRNLRRGSCCLPRPPPAMLPRRRRRCFPRSPQPPPRTTPPAAATNFYRRGHRFVQPCRRLTPPSQTPPADPSLSAAGSQLPGRRVLSPRRRPISPPPPLSTRLTGLPWRRFQVPVPP
ncbi:hypothetical protein BRADI_3g47777v3 [Brachypodium distachyon]|uniref:Uncharacterized protein n=1 Tax=Brachypodium distachyon TaxID=15368 RepID=A0A0Q3FKM0_BRADI|nr:hypothetical protein BRADI_3g47777v3 [Brachypodium distachyon]KQK00176.1 hypothetical protein BRADI_3g47777v3 [Brachypodium distachyon]